jgi:hypothetical protein
VVKELVAADGAASGKEFDDALHMCDCCLETKHGRDFQRLECAHAFCTPCVVEHLATSIQARRRLHTSSSVCVLAPPLLLL